MALSLYRLLLLLLLPVILLLALLRSINHPAYRHRLTERLGLLPQSIKPNGIIIHGASVGEIQALKPFIKQCLATFSDIPITVTSFTPTGSTQIKQLFGEQVQHCYFPLDIWPCTQLFLNRLTPRAIVTMETELWPNLIAQAHKRHIKQLLINGRISDNSFGNYQRFSSLFAPSLKRLDYIHAQSEENAHRFVALGARPETCSAAGNLKFDIELNAAVKDKQAELASLLPAERPTVLFASTHEGDERIAINAFHQLNTVCDNPLLVIVPRHPERFDKVADLLNQHQLKVQRRSHNEKVLPDTQVWLVDTLGELMPAISFADVVVMGGTFSTIGGHNPLEPALFKKPIVVGDDMANFKEIHQLLSDANAIVTLTKTEDVSDQIVAQLQQWLVNPSLAEQFGNNAYHVVQLNQGATNKALAKLRALIER